MGVLCYWNCYPLIPPTTAGPIYCSPAVGYGMVHVGSLGNRINAFGT